MKPYLLIVITLFIYCSNANAQSPHAARLYGTTQYGSYYTKGSIFHYTPETHTFNTDYNFQVKAKGRTPKCDIITGNNGKYYGTTTAGGDYNAGVLFEWDSVTNVYRDLYNFTGADGKDARGGMVLYNNKLYGVTNEGGTNNYGVIYEWDIAANTYTKKIDLDGAGGKNPTGSLTLVNNLFYGFTNSGGVNDKGVLFEWNPATNIYTKQFDFDSVKGSNPVGKLSLYNGKLYAMCNKGGAFNAGIIYQWDYSNNTVTKTFDFNITNGSSPMGYLTLYNNKFYGTTYEGGMYHTGLGWEHYGVIFEYNPATNVFLKKKDLGANSGLRGPLGSLTLKDNVFWATASDDAATRAGGIFTWNPATNQIVFKYGFFVYTSSPCEVQKAASGIQSFESLLLSGNYMLGGFSQGGGNNFGSIFKYLPDSNRFVSFVNMEAADGAYPKGALTKLGNKLYGLTFQGGNNHAGNIFEWDLATQQFKERFQFDGIVTGIWPKSSLALYKGKFYGVNSKGKLLPGTGSFSQREDGDYFSWDPASNVYQSLRSAENAVATPVLLSDQLYAPAPISPNAPGATIAAFDPAANTLTNVAYLADSLGNFCSYQGKEGTNGVTYYNGKFYGMTTGKISSGASPFRGTIYEWDTTTSIIKHRYDFVDSLGTYPTGNLALVGNEFYGLTSNEGNYSPTYPSLFKWNPATNVLKKMKSFFSERPYGTPTYSGGKIYFVTEYSFFNIYEYDPATDTTINVYSEPVRLFQPGGGWNYTNCSRPPSYQQLLEIIPNEAPVLVNSPLAQSICINKKDSTTFTITDADADTMHFNISSSNNSLLPVANIAVTSTGNVYTITYLGSANQTGTATISLTANDGYGDSVNFSFPVSITAAGNCTVVPLTWLSVSAVLQNKKTILNWSVAAEQNNAVFVVERSTDGVTWTTIFTVDGSATAALQNNYTGIDAAPATGINFYRIKQVDVNGRFTYSATVTVKVSTTKASVVIYPNPAQDAVYYELQNGGTGVITNLQLFSTDGKLLKQLPVNNARGNFSVLDLPPGIYVLKVKDSAGKNENKKLIINR